MDGLVTAGLAAVVLPIVAAFVFGRVGRDYARYGRLTKTSTALQLALFVLHGVSSYAFLDSRLSDIDSAGPLFGFAVVLLAGGLILLLTTVKQFGVKKMVGHETAGLSCAGMYRRSRNPQLVFYGIMVLGYALLWPSWTGAVWVVLYAVLAQMMVRTEESHLKRTFGSEYVEYCARTPRYIDLPGMK